MKRHLPLIAAVALYWLAVAIFLLVALRMNEGQFTYALDDSYIHMAMARNFAQDGVWGVTPYHFSSSSSSPLWTLSLVGFYKLFGVNEWWPLLMNLAAGTLLLATAHVILLRFALHVWVRVAALLALVFFPSLPALTLTGQEHILHAWLTILFVYVAGRALADAGEWPPRANVQSALLLLLAALVTGGRYEGVFVVLVACILFLVRRRFLFALLLALASLGPILLMGIISSGRGWFFLPNSVLLKGISPDLSSLRTIIPTLLAFVERLSENSYMLVLLIVALLVLQLRWMRRRRFWETPQIMIVLFVGATLLHMQFITTAGLLFRYDGYLVILGILCIAAGLEGDDFAFSFEWQSAAAYVIPLLLVFFLLLPLLKRGGHSLLNLPLAMNNIYEQQYHMGQFAQRYYAGERVAANDIGAINFYGEIEGYDLWGLGSLEPAIARRSRAYNADIIDELTRNEGIKIAIVYDNWFIRYGGLPERWQRVGQWTVRENVLSGEKTLSIYAVDPSEAGALAQYLRAYSAELPAAVQQSGAYLEP